jgi:hypothetical protein
MNATALALAVLLCTAVWTLPARWAPAALTACCTTMTLGQSWDIGPVTLPLTRLVIATGIARVVIRGEHMAGEWNRSDRLTALLGAWLLLASLFHDGSPGSGPVYISGMLFNILGAYFLTRTWMHGPADAEAWIRAFAWLLVPVALAMIVEKSLARNPFAIFGGVPEAVLSRAGKLRAQGPFAHPILAGTVGAAAIPLFAAILRRHPATAATGMAAGLTMVAASSSSGPVMTLAAGCAALLMWWRRGWVRPLALSCVPAYLALMLVMERPPYYLISKIDISGGSTGWHRSFLIERTFAHIGEWWLFGTDATRHWMPQQGTASAPNHTDITNHYIAYGVMGGLAAMLLLVAVFGGLLGAVLRTATYPETAAPEAFTAWALGAGLFAHAVTGISVSYFDQSVLLLWMNAAAISALIPQPPAPALR